MKNNKFTSFKYVVRNNLKHKDKVMVQVFFIYNYKNAVRTIEFDKKDESDAYYINEAKKIINQEINDGKLAKFAKHYGPKKVSKRILKVALASVISLGVVGSATYGAYHIINNIQTRDSAVKSVVNQIKALNENSTLDEINEAIKAYEDLPDYLKTSVSKDTKDYLDQQVELYKVDRTAADAVDAFTAPFTLEDTTETLVKEAETKIDALTTRGHTLIRKGTEEFIEDIKEAIEVDKAKAKVVNDEIALLEFQTSTVQQVIDIIEQAIALSARAYSYITQESKEIVETAVIIIEEESALGEYMTSVATEYALENTLCTKADIDELDDIYTNWLTQRAQEIADERGFSTQLQNAKNLWTRDDGTSTTLADLAKALDPTTCLNADIKVVTDKEAELKVTYPDSTFNQRTKNLLQSKGYDSALKNAKDALAADIAKTQAFYTQEAKLSDNCSQAEIDQVRADFNNYLATATQRLTYLISNNTEECDCNLKAYIETAQQSYNNDLNEAKTKYDAWCKLLTPSSSIDDINQVSIEYDYFKESTAKERIKGFLAKGGQYDIQAKIDEAKELWDKDDQMAKNFNQAMYTMPGTYEGLTTEQKMLMVSANEYLNKKADSKHLYLSNRAKTLVDPSCVNQLNSLITEAGDKFALTLEPKLNDDEYAFFSSDNIVRFDPTVGLYVEITYVKNDYEYENPRFTKVMGSASSSDYPTVFNPDKYNHVISRVYVPNGVNKNLKIEGVRYIAASTDYESFINITPSYDNFVTVDIEINGEYHYMYGRYNGYTIGIKNQKDADIGKVFKVTGHYSEMR